MLWRQIGTSWKLNILVVIFSLVISKIGLEKNSKVEYSKVPNHPPGRSPSKRYEFIHYAQYSHRAIVGQVVRRIRWEKLCVAWAKLNTDGPCLGNPRICGGVVQDELGGWLGGFLSKIGITTSFLAKLWAWALVLVVLKSHIAIFSTTIYKNGTPLVEPKWKFLASQQQCTAKDGCSL